MEEILTVKDLAAYLKVSHSKILWLAQRGRIPAFMVGELWRFHLDEIQEWLKKKSLESQVRNERRMLGSERAYGRPVVERPYGAPVVYSTRQFGLEIRGY